MYLPKSKYRTFSTPGTEYTDDQGVPYKGSAFETYKGEFYAGETPQTLIKQIYPIASEPEGEEESILRQEFPQPTPRDYKLGYWTRYLVQDTRDGKVYEVGERTFKAVKGTLYYRTIFFLWRIRGPIEDTGIGKYSMEGASTENRNRMNVLESSIPGITRNLDPRQFVV